MTKPHTRPSLTILLLLLAACSTTGKSGGPGTGGTRDDGIGSGPLGSGGTLGIGGLPGSGGSFAGTGGTLGVGGMAGSGGKLATGGTSGAGGLLGFGGVSSPGGAGLARSGAGGSGSGGMKTDGGGTGGTTSTGGAVGSGGVDADANARDASDTQSLTDICRAAIQVQCARMAFYMGGTTFRKELNTQDCLRRAEYCPGYYFAADSNRTADNVSACLDALATRPLTDVSLFVFPACLASGKRPVGAGCTYSSQCQSGQCGATGQCSTCLAQPGVGSKCPDTGGCRPGSYCNKATGLCADVQTVVHAAEGQLCNLSASPVVGCQGDLYCLSTSPDHSGVCTALPSAGQPCATADYPGQCAAGADCTGDAGGTCATPGGCGSSAQCDTASYCDTSKSAPVCAPRNIGGQPCYNYNTSVHYGCLAPATCNLSTGMCFTGRASGESCDTNDECDVSLLCMAGTCQPQDTLICPA